MSCHATSTPTTEPDPPPATPRAARGDGFPIDYAKWETLTKDPVVTNHRMMLDCRAPRPYQLKADGTSPENVDSPHHVPALRYLADPDHRAAVKDGKAPYAVGTTIVKEKLHRAEDKKPFAVAAMIKREAGYDPDHGDWEYVYTTLGEKPETVRGKLDSCIACHRIKKGQDYLYRSPFDRTK